MTRRGRGGRKPQPLSLHALQQQSPPAKRPKYMRDHVIDDSKEDEAEEEDETGSEDEDL